MCVNPQQFLVSNKMEVPFSGSFLCGPGLHVAMTRSKDELDLILPQRLFMYQQNGHESGQVYVSISRFIPKQKHWSEPGAKTRFSKSQVALEKDRRCQ